MAKTHYTSPSNIFKASPSDMLDYGVFNIFHIPTNTHIGTLDAAKAHYKFVDSIRPLTPANLKDLAEFATLLQYSFTD